MSNHDWDPEEKAKSLTPKNFFSFETILMVLRWFKKTGSTAQGAKNALVKKGLVESEKEKKIKKK